MCRMLMSYIPDSDTDRAEVLRSFLHLADDGQVLPESTKGHKDGWGIASYARGNIIRHFRSAESAMNDPLRENEFFLASAHKPDTMLAHVRKVTIGEPAERNSHPFVSGRRLACDAARERR